MDARLRQLERTWLESGLEEDLILYVRARIRAGETDLSPPNEIPKALSSYDWPDVFKYAGEDSESRYSDPGSVPKYAVSPTSDLFSKTAPGFTRKNVQRVISVSEGVNDEESWYACVQLWDGRFGYVEAWCDYTGWG